MTNALPFSRSADANKEVICAQLRANLQPGARVLEIGSGTGQHAVHFAGQMADIIWQPSDRNIDDMGLLATLKTAALPNIEAPFALDVLHWPSLRPKFDAVYSANCIHAMPVENLKPYVEGAAASLKAGGAMMFYGPFKYAGQFTTESNESFNQWLVETFPGGGIRDFETVDTFAQENGLAFVSDTAMPSNNQFLVWRKP